MANQAITSVPKHLAASTPQGLRRLMLLENAKYGVAHQFKDFYYDPKTKKHMCWFYPLDGSTIQEQIEVSKEILNGSD